MNKIEKDELIARANKFIGKQIRVRIRHVERPVTCIFIKTNSPGFGEDGKGLAYKTSAILRREDNGKIVSRSLKK
ncbi:MAG: hypothetical protein EOP00_27840 [Pedobacter sp.]|nr:MAG: hypothetical protein EOP00_27840 [Pedobacter sp.]